MDSSVSCSGFRTRGPTAPADTSTKSGILLDWLEFRPYQYTAQNCIPIAGGRVRMWRCLCAACAIASAQKPRDVRCNGGGPLVPRKTGIEVVCACDHVIDDQPIAPLGRPRQLAQSFFAGMLLRFAREPRGKWAASALCKCQGQNRSCLPGFALRRSRETFPAPQYRSAIL